MYVWFLWIGLSGLVTQINAHTPDTATPSGWEKIDEVSVIIYGPERTRIICASEIGSIGVDGRHRGLKDIILEELLYQETIKYKIPVDEAAVDKYIDSIRKANNLSLDDVKDIFRRAGYSYQGGREQLSMMYASNAMIELKVTSRLVVVEEQARAYHEQNPLCKPASFQLQRIFFPYHGQGNKDEVCATLENQISGGQGADFNWGQPFKLRADQIAPQLGFIRSMSPGTISEPIDTGSGFELYRVASVKPERSVPFEKRYKDIVDELRAPKFQQELEKYTKELFECASIVYLDQHIEQIAREQIGQEYES